MKETWKYFKPERTLFTIIEANSLRYIYTDCNVNSFCDVFSVEYKTYSNINKANFWNLPGTLFTAWKDNSTNIVMQITLVTYLFWEQNIYHDKQKQLPK